MKNQMVLYIGLLLIFVLSFIGCLESEVSSSYQNSESFVSERIFNNTNRKLVSTNKQLKKGGDLSELNSTSFTDFSGDIEIRVWEASGYGPGVTVYCSVDPDFVLVGGGAKTDGGGLLIGNNPLDANLTTWVARSKMHLYVAEHPLTCYAIGIKLKNISRNTLMKYVSLRTNISSVDNAYTSITVSVPGGKKLLEEEQVCRMELGICCVSLTPLAKQPGRLHRVHTVIFFLQPLLHMQLV
ncbi:MAG: hypothetical protein H3C45_11950 [Bacteroidia bacterium]|nr:hypothetical protein [Bacteroidia bacterium]